MKRLMPITWTHGRTVKTSLRQDTGLDLYHQAFPQLAESGYSGVDNNGTLLPSAVGQTQVGQESLNALHHYIDFSELYGVFYGDKYTRLSREDKESAEQYARETAQVLCSKCIDWHDDEGCDADDLRLLLILMATKGKWTLQLASQQMTHAWYQRTTSEEEAPRAKVQHGITLERGMLIGFNQAYLHKITSQCAVTSKQQPLVMLNFPSVTLD